MATITRPEGEAFVTREELEKTFPICVARDVRWGDMDAFQHVNNSVYFRYFEDARIAYFTGTGVTESTGTPNGAGPILASTSCRFKAPLTYPDTVHIGARVVTLGDDRFTMEYAVLSESLGRVVAKGEAVVVAFDYDAMRKTQVQPQWRAAIEKIEGKSF